MFLHGAKPIPAFVLHERILDFQAGSRHRGSLFPLFDLSGNVQQFMVLFSYSNRIYLIPYEMNLVELSLLGRVRIKLKRESMESFGGVSLSDFRGLFHYDPWWELNKPRFLNHRARNMIMETNCLNRFGHKIVKVTFRRDLSRLESIILVTDSPEISYKSVKLSEMNHTEKISVFQAGKESVTGRVREDWILDPVWNMDEWGRPLECRSTEKILPPLKK